MKRFYLNYLVITALAISAVACSKDNENGGSSGNGGKGGGTITMTISKSGAFEIGIAGTGSITIDWGDGTGKETFSISSFDGLFTNDDGIHNYYDLKEKYSYKHYFSGAGRTITITGENITALYYGWHQTNVKNPIFLTSLDVSGCKTLIDLDCGFNQLTNLNVSKKNTALINLNCRCNRLTESALNTLFESLPDRSRDEFGLIAINNNPYNLDNHPNNSGTESCNQNIATAKNWGVLPFADSGNLAWYREQILQNNP